MKLFDDILDDEVTDILRQDGVGIIRTDTLYGLVARADSQAAVERIFSIKRRSPDKPVLVLVHDETGLFDAYPVDSLIGTVWPGKNTVILPAPSAPDWVTRGTKTVAYRLPEAANLRQLLERVGPLVAPSANLEGEAPAITIEQAISYFGDAVDFYVDGGEVTDTAPSRLLRLLDNGIMERLR